MMRAYANEVRVAFGKALLHDDLLLKIVSHGVRMCIVGDQVTALSERERRALRKAIAHIREARKLLRTVARRCVDETE